MEANYNADMYITHSDFSEVENKLEEVTNRVQDIIYFEETSQLRNIEVGDDLSGKTLYLSFPTNAYEYINNEEYTEYVISTTGEQGITFRYDVSVLMSLKYITIKYLNEDEEYVANLIYSFDMDDAVGNPYLNIVRFKLPDNFGVVSNINENTELYQYIKIYEDESIIPDYVKKEWSQNEIPFMQDIDRIEQGIKNLGDYCTKPIGWVTPRVWLGTNSVDNRSDYNVSSKGFSYQDINRWITDLNLIDNVDMERGTFWNTNKTEYIWNEEDD